MLLKSSICVFDRVENIMGKGEIALNEQCFLHSTSLLKTVGKGEIARNEEFLLFPQCFYPFEELSAIFFKFKIVVCKLFQFRSLKFVGW